MMSYFVTDEMNTSGAVILIITDNFYFIGNLPINVIEQMLCYRDRGSIMCPKSRA